jgi:hypothetical protein
MKCSSDYKPSWKPNSGIQGCPMKPAGTDIRKQSPERCGAYIASKGMGPQV